MNVYIRIALSMNIQFYAKNVELSDKMKVHISSKLEAGLKHFKRVVGAQIDVSRDQHHRKGDVYRVEVNLHIPRKIIRGIATATDVFAAMDIAQERIEKQVSRFRDKIKTERKRGWRVWVKQS
ncbi:MAG: ribosomal subunit interface protein [Candidatus Jacksonbacteria bacterium RIFCSPLOWO2_02_FULL_43_9]|uniref:Ribosome-associated factor Y n=1 Tax=Candidatus Falkowbacteria bacterium GW2011_GWA2_41_14 TaxID=1618635 RepID=A0A0G0XUN1_9BACT|nr:MAG: Ribosome-associated factor Y [Candidatus Falkowbacteria bacterium GW2011_GWA2_41_14]OGY68948.1 MAG: ribosomal subunit interface protein [Candidatus Jacksonbacteria bacterium RIFCSPHIGHO2_02_FULL_43_10]OGY70954.1 MAG: ribosomal subunit interface protein [Candidatus Jacksonbacteria bacterium RIFCSPLOWO2_01_FULL_44_13]OGY71816.1 MAG: ribosomal subunit interface protein [Candidatus Jacksonbacteria bacterium RIFCSPLOWO2_02_FULL_43_9]HAZ16473.1 ribosome-associated translation inhibitor RaiA [